MYFLFADETNTSPKSDNRVKFLVYGGLIIPADKIDELDRGITKIRKQAGYESTASLKFDSRSRPSTVSIEQFASTKDQVVDLCTKLGCKFLAYVILHKIAESQGISKTIKWGADHIVGKFNYFLKLNNSIGITIVDRFSDVNEYSFLTEKFTSGLIYENKIITLDNIKIFASSCDNASNISSAMDIVLGSFRYCINQPYNIPAAKTMIKKIVLLIWGNKHGDNNEHIDPFEKGLTLRPKLVKNHEYKKEYENLISYLNKLLS